MGEVLLTLVELHDKQVDKFVLYYNNDNNKIDNNTNNNTDNKNNNRYIPCIQDHPPGPEAPKPHACRKRPRLALAHHRHGVFFFSLRISTWFFSFFFLAHNRQGRLFCLLQSSLVRDLI